MRRYDILLYADRTWKAYQGISWDAELNGDPLFPAVLKYPKHRRLSNDF